MLVSKGNWASNVHMQVAGLSKQSESWEKKGGVGTLIKMQIFCTV